MGSSSADPASPVALDGRRALVLGGSVFVGRHLVSTLAAGGARVSVLNRGRTPFERPEGVEHLIADRTDPEQMRAVLDGRDWDAVFDVSGFVMAAGGSDIEELLALLDGHVGRYVYTSSIMAYDQSLVGTFPWTEDLPTNSDGPASYGGFKARAEEAMLARHARTGFPAVVVRPAAIYGPHNNIFDMETPMFLRLLRHRPVLVPHGGLVVGSYGHVEDLCSAMLTLAVHPAAPGEVFNVSTDSVDVNRYVAVLADVVGTEPDVVPVPDEMLAASSDPTSPAVFGHLFSARHHAMLCTDKLHRLTGHVPRYDLRSGHADTYDWFRRQGRDAVREPLRDPVWKATWDFEAEAAWAERIRGG